MKRLIPGFILICLALMIAAGCGGSDKKGGKDGGRLSIAVIPKGTTHEYWKTIHAGANKAAREFDVDVVWKGPLKEDDREEQVQVVETFVSAGVDAMVLAPLDDRALVLPVREGKGMGIPTVIIDSALQGDSHVSFVATDNYLGGAMAAERLGELTGGKGKLIVLRYIEGSASTTERGEGFLATIREKYPDLEILSDNQYGGATTESSYQATENLLNRFPEVSAFFAANESSCFGALRAIQDAGLAGKIVYVGFDSSEKLIEALKQGEIQGLVLQNPFVMGYLGVKTAVEYLRGVKVEKRIDTGVTVVTPDNLNDPDIQELLYPDLSQYLDE